MLASAIMPNALRYFTRPWTTEPRPEVSWRNSLDGRRVPVMSRSEWSIKLPCPPQVSVLLFDGMCFDHGFQLALHTPWYLGYEPR